MTYSAEYLYSLLPAIYRIRDAEQGYALKALVEVLAEQAGVMEQDIAGLYQNWFIETCAPWVVPYIGDLVGNRPIHPVRQSTRADVAKTLYYRRRKGTLAMLEELARDVTGWGAHAVEFFELLGWNQNLNHLRHSASPPQGHSRLAATPVVEGHLNPAAFRRVGTVNLRDSDALDRLSGPFDPIAHSVDVRRIGSDQGWYNLKNLGFFLWRLQAYPLEQVRPKRSSIAHGFFFSPLGLDAPLFTDSAAETDPSGLAAEIHVPGAIRPMALLEDLEGFRRSGHSDYYGEEASLVIYRDGVAVPPDEVCCMNLQTWTEPPPGKVGVDVRRGRFSVRAAEQDLTWTASYAYGFAGDLGGGPYRRLSQLAQDWQQRVSGTLVWRQEVTQDPALLAQDPSRVATLLEAINAWKALPPNRMGIITLLDSQTYAEDLTGPNAIPIPANSRLLLSARQGVRPHLLGDLSVRGAGGGELGLEGLLIEGNLSVLSGDLGRLRLAHCTMVPDRDNQVVNVNASSVRTENQNAALEIELERCICGTLELPETVPRLSLLDCIVDPAGGPNQAVQARGSLLQLKGCTLLGSVEVKRLEASDTLFMGLVRVEQRQEGCVRFCYVPEASTVPRRYRCQPDLALAAAKEAKGADLTPAEAGVIRSRLVPSFTSTRYGDPGFAQLRFDVAREIYTGGENAAEMGAFNFLLQPQREANLLTRLEEYLPVGLEAGLIFVN